jgi:hypothetical protein
LSLPAAATTTASRRCANTTAERSAEELTAVCTDTLITCAPAVAASRMPWASSRENPVSPVLTLTDRIRAAGATP